jgi:hypothetical protein
MAAGEREQGQGNNGDEKPQVKRIARERVGRSASQQVSRSASQQVSVKSRRRQLGGCTRQRLAAIVIGTRISLTCRLADR